MVAQRKCGPKKREVIESWKKCIMGSSTLCTVYQLLLRRKVKQNGMVEVYFVHGERISANRAVAGLTGVLYVCEC
jgi:hypothetical protein